MLSSILDERSSLKYQLKYLFSKINKSLSSLSRVRNTFNAEEKKLLYFAQCMSTGLVVNSHLTALLYKTDMNTLFRIQRKLIRMVYNVSERYSIYIFHDLRI